MGKSSILTWILRIIPAFILLQTLFFKFTGAPESIFIFTELGAEPELRYFSGVIELISGVLLLIPKYTWAGATLGLGLMTGAIIAHFIKLGIVVNGDGGTLFIMAVVTFICCSILVWKFRHQVPVLKNLV